jgi:predicted branched-subunit amino acid permease
MSASTVFSAARRGVRASLPFGLVVAPFAVLFGAVATEAGLDVAQVMGFSVLVIAGAAQFTALQLMSEQAPAAMVLLSALAVNLRMAMYSAALAPHLGAAPLWQRALVAYFLVDQVYAVSVARYEAERMSRPVKVAFCLGAAAPMVPFWYGGTLAGALLGQAVPAEGGLDFAVPITFLALVAPALRTLAHVAAAGVASGLGLALAFLPWNTGLLVAALAAMATGAEVERRLARRRTGA